MIARVIVLFFGGMLVAFFIALSQVNLETLRGNVLSILRNATGMPVEIAGDVSWKFSLRPRIELNQVRVPNAEWAKHKYAFSAEKIDVTLDLLSLFRPMPTIQNVKIYDADVCLEKNTAGEYSVVMNQKKTEETPKTDAEVEPKRFPFEDPGLGGVEVRNLTAHVFDKKYSLADFSLRYVPRDDTREYTGWIKNGDDVFPFILSYYEYNAERRVYPLRVAFSTGGDALIADIALEGTSHAPIDFVIKGDIPDVSAVGRLLQLDLTQIPTMRVNISGGLDRTKLTLRKSSFSVRGNEVRLSGSVDWGRPRIAIKANVESKSINLTQVFPEWYQGTWVRPKRDLNVFKDTPLFGKELRNFNINLNAKIGKLVVYRDLAISDIDVHAKLTDGVARVEGDVSMGSGKITIGADANIDGDGRYFATAAVRGRDIRVGEILTQVRETDLLSDLPTNIDVYLQGNGTTLSELMATATGPVQVKSSGAGYAHSALVAYMYGTDFLTTLRHSVQDMFRSEKKYNQMKISCVALNTKFRDGIAETQQGVAVETNAINLRLAGSLNLGKEKLKMALTTVPVRGIKLSLTGNVVNSIEITGNLAEPDIKISGAAVAGKVASATGLGLLLAPFTGGIGLVAGAGVGLLAGDLLENWLADEHPCETAMTRGAPPMRDDPDWLNIPVADLEKTVITSMQQVTEEQNKEENNTKSQGEKNV